MENKIERMLGICKNIGKVVNNITLVLAVCAVACFSGWYFGGKAAEKESTENLIETFASLGYYSEISEIEIKINPFNMKTNIRTNMDEISKNWESYNADYPYEDSYDTNYEDSYYEDSYNYDTNYYVPEESESNFSEFSNDSNNDGIPDNMVDSNHDGIPDGFSEVRH